MTDIQSKVADVKPGQIEMLDDKEDICYDDNNEHHPRGCIVDGSCPNCSRDMLCTITHICQVHQYMYLINPSKYMKA